MQTTRASALGLQLVDALFESSALTAGKVSELLSVTRRTAQLHLDRLQKVEILREVTGWKRNRVYISPGILSIFRTTAD